MWEIALPHTATTAGFPAPSAEKKPVFTELNEEDSIPRQLELVIRGGGPQKGADQG